MTSRNYLGKMNSTLGSVVPLAMFYYTGASNLDPISNIIKKALIILEGLDAARLASS